MMNRAEKVCLAVSAAAVVVVAVVVVVVVAGLWPK